MSKRLGIVAVLTVVSSATLFAHGPSGHHGASAGAAYGKAGDPQQEARMIVVTMKEAEGRMVFEAFTY